MAVRGRAGDTTGGDGGGAAADVLDHEVVSELLGELWRQHTGELIGRTARWIRHNERDRALRILLREPRCGPDDQTDNGCYGADDSNADDSTHGSFRPR